MEAIDGINKVTSDSFETSAMTQPKLEFVLPDCYKPKPHKGKSKESTDRIRRRHLRIERKNGIDMDKAYVGGTR